LEKREKTKGVRGRRLSAINKTETKILFLVDCKEHRMFKEIATRGREKHRKTCGTLNESKTQAAEKCRKLLLRGLESWGVHQKTPRDVREASFPYSQGDWTSLEGIPWTLWSLASPDAGCELNRKRVGRGGAPAKNRWNRLMSIQLLTVQFKTPRRHGKRKLSGTKY